VRFKRDWSLIQMPQKHLLRSAIKEEHTITRITTLGDLKATVFSEISSENVND
jgi:hypothetical protein